MRPITPITIVLALLLCVTGGDARSRRRSYVSKDQAIKNPAASVTAETLAPGPILGQAYVLMDASSGRVLLEHNAHKRMFPASTTKTMTALVAIEQGNLDQTVTIGPNPPAVGEASVNLLQGEQFRLSELVQAALIKSANDSCVAIAEGVAGTIPKFVEMMNAKAREVGALDTHFANPHGLHDPNHYTTPYDLALIARAAMKHPFFNQTIATRETVIHGNYKIGPQRLLVNRNRLLFRWNECDGVKTGYTRQAGKCLVASATRTDRATGQPWRLISVVMHSPDTWHDCANLLLHQGFERLRPVQVAKEGESFETVEVPGGAFRTQAVAAREVLLSLYDEEQATLTRTVHLTKLAAPLKKGQYVGDILFYAGAKRLAKVPLVAEESVPASLVTRVVPAAGRILPADSDMRLHYYYGLGALILAFTLLLLIVKMRTAERSKAGAY